MELEIFCHVFLHCKFFVNLKWRHSVNNCLYWGRSKKKSGYHLSHYLLTYDFLWLSFPFFDYFLYFLQCIFLIFLLHNLFLFTPLVDTSLQCCCCCWNSQLLYCGDITSKEDQSSMVRALFGTNSFPRNSHTNIHWREQHVIWKS